MSKDLWVMWLCGISLSTEIIVAVMARASGKDEII